MTSLKKAQAALKAFQNSKVSFACDVCGHTIRIVPPIPEVMRHKDCTGTFQKVIS
jgi:hypothetical protein